MQTLSSFEVERMPSIYESSIVDIILTGERHIAFFLRQELTNHFHSPHSYSIWNLKSSNSICSRKWNKRHFPFLFLFFLIFRKEKLIYSYLWFDFLYDNILKLIGITRTNKLSLTRLQRSSEVVRTQLNFLDNTVKSWEIEMLNTL